jgi:uncharacterized protein (TIGR00369 family)
MADEEEAENFESLAGYEIVQWADGHAAVELDVSRKHRNRSGNLHGGMTTSLLDVACARALTWAAEGEPPRYVSTLSITVNFLRPAGPGRVRAVGRALPGGRRVVTCHGELTDASGQIIAVCQGVFQRREPKG